ncbi:MAG: hypothetical protein LQ350_003856 [Teloschistes chrysophthalmus]|nr:MAG: hypothetical protein LQ350_003856 [Niorma chrysophthalma]
MPSNAVTDWIASIPRNTQASVQRLTLLGWARLILVVVAYLVIRPYLMRYAERAQTRNFERIDDERSSGVTPNSLREAEGASTGTSASTGSGSGTAKESGEGTRRRHVKQEYKDNYEQYDEATRAEIRRVEGEGEGLDDEDMDAEFLKKYCT